MLSARRVLHRSRTAVACVLLASALSIAAGCGAPAFKAPTIGGLREPYSGLEPGSGTVTLKHVERSVAQAEAEGRLKNVRDVGALVAEATSGDALAYAWHFGSAEKRGEEPLAAFVVVPRLPNPEAPWRESLAGLGLQPTSWFGSMKLRPTETGAMLFTTTTPDLHAAVTDGKLVALVKTYPVRSHDVTRPDFVWYIIDEEKQQPLSARRYLVDLGYDVDGIEAQFAGLGGADVQRLLGEVQRLRVAANASARASTAQYGDALKGLDDKDDRVFARAVLDLLSARAATKWKQSEVAEALRLVTQPYYARMTEVAADCRASGRLATAAFLSVARQELEMGQSVATHRSKVPDVLASTQAADAPAREVLQLFAAVVPVVNGEPRLGVTDSGLIPLFELADTNSPETLKALEEAGAERAIAERDGPIVTASMEEVLRPTTVMVKKNAIVTDENPAWHDWNHQRELLEIRIQVHQKEIAAAGATPMVGRTLRSEGRDGQGNVVVTYGENPLDSDVGRRAAHGQALATYRRIIAETDAELAAHLTKEPPRTAERQGIVDEEVPATIQQWKGKLTVPFVLRWTNGREVRFTHTLSYESREYLKYDPQANAAFRLNQHITREKAIENAQKSKEGVNLADVIVRTAVAKDLPRRVSERAAQKGWTAEETSVEEIAMVRLFIDAGYQTRK